MSTVGKAISLLELFTAEEPELGLTDLVRKGGFDKATTRRLLVSLAGPGLIEQDAVSRRYRLGPGLSRLARIRDAHFPLLQIAVPIIRELAQQTGETVHLSELSGGSLATVHVEEPAKAIRVSVAVGQVLPLHGTASGIVFLAFARPGFVEAYLDKSLAAFTSHTLTDRAQIREAIKAAALRGYSRGDQGYEDGVFSVAAPVLGTDGWAVGTVAVASPLSRIDATTAERHGLAATGAAAEIAARLFGKPAAQTPLTQDRTKAS
jgi:DNA-binding IclR family transcriptional regulator